jgi:hypothetical protein
MGRKIWVIEVKYQDRWIPMYTIRYSRQEAEKALGAKRVQFKNNTTEYRIAEYVATGEVCS